MRGRSHRNWPVIKEHSIEDDAEATTHPEVAALFQEGDGLRRSPAVLIMALASISGYLELKAFNHKGKQMVPTIETDIAG